jgi:hypothetical protein
MGFGKRLWAEGASRGFAGPTGEGYDAEEGVGTVNDLSFWVERWKAEEDLKGSSEWGSSPLSI